MRATILSAFALASAACACPELARGIAHHKAGLRAQRHDPLRARAEFEAARADLIAALDTCDLAPETQVDLCARVAHCQIALGRADLAARHIERAHRLLETIPSWRHERLPGDPVFLLWMRAEHHARRATTIRAALAAIPPAHLDAQYAVWEQELRTAKTLLYQARSRAWEAWLDGHLRLRAIELHGETARLHERLAERHNLPERHARALAEVRQALQLAREESGDFVPFEQDLHRWRHELPREEERLAVIVEGRPR